MIVDISNEVLTKIKTELVGVNVLTSFPSTEPDFPCVIFEDKSNPIHEETIDSGGVKYNTLTFEISIFSDAQNRMTICRELAQRVDLIMSGIYRMNRYDVLQTPNLQGKNLYRYVMKYNCVVNASKTIYRR